jgi:hypothetical protein
MTLFDPQSSRTGNLNRRRSTTLEVDASVVETWREKRFTISLAELLVQPFWEMKELWICLAIPGGATMRA